jgi:uncharacterized protein YutE (UPF0331/DUF86 family)
MAQTSPILRFALEVFHHALENYASGSPRHHKVAVMGLAQSIELTTKATLVENNIPIFEKSGRTINTHDALANLARLWGSDRVDQHARIELLVDERNAIQHRYGNVDDVSLDYHMETAFEFLRTTLEREFDTSLDGWVHDNVDSAIWTKIRFVAKPEPTAEEPSGALVPDRSATLDFIDGFSRFERAIRWRLSDFLPEGQRYDGSTLDFAIKALSNAGAPPHELIQRLPIVYKLRNRTIHGDQTPDVTDVDAALRTLDEVLNALATIDEEVLERAIRASERGVRGTRLPTRTEEAQEDFADYVRPAGSVSDSESLADASPLISDEIGPWHTEGESNVT